MLAIVGGMPEAFRPKANYLKTRTELRFISPMRQELQEFCRRPIIKKLV